ncbi:MAG: redoxin domain-containing protein [Bacteroidota bacterium]
MKKLLIIVPILAIVTLTIFAVSGIRHKKEVQSGISQFPDIELKSLSGTDIRIKDSLRAFSIPTAVILFSTQCDFCEYEMKEIIDNISDFPANCKILLLSSENIVDLRLFHDKYKIYDYEILSVYQLSNEQISKKFGTVSTPAIFVYDQNGALVRQFTGETKAAVLIDNLSF